jgi:hypothetical protein
VCWIRSCETKFISLVWDKLVSEHSMVEPLRLKLFRCYEIMFPSILGTHFLSSIVLMNFTRISLVVLHDIYMILQNKNIVMCYAGWIIPYCINNPLAIWLPFITIIWHIYHTSETPPPAITNHTLIHCATGRFMKWYIYILEFANKVPVYLEHAPFCMHAHTRAHARAHIRTHIHTQSELVSHCMWPPICSPLY